MSVASIVHVCDGNHLSVFASGVFLPLIIRYVITNVSRCSALQCCSELQCVAVCCSVVQCVAEYYGCAFVIRS